jgi:S1-C subfamily serine protease
VWAVPARTELAPGSFLFTNSAEWAGLVIAHIGGLAIVPAGTVLPEAERLLATPPGPAGSIGIEVQDLTGPLSAATGAPAGVVVTWVDADGAGRDQLMVGDVIEAVDGQPLATRQQWDVRLARLTVGETLSLRVRRRAEVLEVAAVATRPAAPAPASRSLGLTLRTRTKIGVEVVRVEQGSAAERAALAAGDIITLVAGAPGPTPEQVIRSYTSLGPSERVMIAVTRGDAHFVTTLER